jgi:hypothetical protein
MRMPYLDTTSEKPTVIEGFEGEIIEITIEELEKRTVPQSTAGFLE